MSKSEQDSCVTFHSLPSRSLFLTYTQRDTLEEHQKNDEKWNMPALDFQKDWDDTQANITYPEDAAPAPVASGSGS